MFLFPAFFVEQKQSKMADSEAFHSLGEEEEEATEVETDEMDTGKGVKHPCIRCWKEQRSV